MIERVVITEDSYENVEFVHHNENDPGQVSVRDQTLTYLRDCEVAVTVEPALDSPAGEQGGLGLISWGHLSDLYAPRDS